VYCFRVSAELDAVPKPFEVTNSLVDFLSRGRSTRRSYDSDDIVLLEAGRLKNIHFSAAAVRLQGSPKVKSI
jgi:hypothetical protein